MIDYHVVAASAFLNSSVTFGALHSRREGGRWKIEKEQEGKKREREREGLWGQDKVDTIYSHL